MTATDGWDERDVAALAHVVRHGRTGHRLTKRILEDLRQLIDADHVALLERRERDHREDELTVVTPARPTPEAGNASDVWRRVWAGEVCDTEAPENGCPADHVHVADMADDGHPLASSRIMLAPLATAHTLARVVLVRHHRDFHERDRLLLALLRPHLAAAYRRSAERRTAGTALTARQRAVLHLVARGCSNDEIAARLVVSPGTVRKHLDNVFRQLGVSSRAAAVVRAFPDGLPPYLPDRPALAAAGPPSLVAADVRALMSADRPARVPAPVPVQRG